MVLDSLNTPMLPVNLKELHDWWMNGNLHICLRTKKTEKHEGNSHTPAIDCCRSRLACTSCPWPMDTARHSERQNEITIQRMQNILTGKFVIQPCKLQSFGHFKNILSRCRSYVSIVASLLFLNPSWDTTGFAFLLDRHCLGWGVWKW